jgi:hypothetical protein
VVDIIVVHDTDSFSHHVTHGLLVVWLHAAPCREVRADENADRHYVKMKRQKPKTKKSLKQIKHHENCGKCEI